MNRKSLRKSKGLILFILSLSLFQCSESEVAEALIGGSGIISSPKNVGPDFEFIYYVGPRFNKTVSKETVEEAKSVLDIMPEVVGNDDKTFQNVKVTRFAENREDWLIVQGENENFNEEQIDLLKSLDYGESFSVSMNLEKNHASGDEGEDGDNEIDLVEQRKSLSFLSNFGNTQSNIDDIESYDRRDSVIRYISIVPEMPARYSEGVNNLIDYIKDESKDFVGIARRSEIYPGKISFVVDRKGKITKVELAATSNYPSIDKKMIELVKGIPGDWKPGKNAKGEAVDQELILFFGNMGC